MTAQSRMTSAGDQNQVTAALPGKNDPNIQLQMLQIEVREVTETAVISKEYGGDLNIQLFFQVTIWFKEM